MRAGSPGSGDPRRLLVAVALGCATYGAAMGSYRVELGGRALLLLYGAIKTPMLLAVTSAVCVPAFFVLNTVAGLREDLREATRALLHGQAAMALVLASLAPPLVVFYLSIDDYSAARIVNVVTFTLASVLGQRVSRRRYAGLIEKNPRHRLLLRVWFLLFAFVGIQLGWTLRPYIGFVGAEVSFLRDEPFTNAYVFFARLLTGQAK